MTKKGEKVSTDARSAGLEPALPEGIWFLVRRLNHSATTAQLLRSAQKEFFEYRGFESKGSIFCTKLIHPNLKLIWIWLTEIQFVTKNHILTESDHREELLHIFNLM